MSDREAVPPEIQRQVQELVDEACAEFIRLQESHAEMLEALRGMLRLMDDGLLVRDISRDHEPGWAVRQMPLVMGIKRAQTALANAERIRGGGRLDG